MSNVPPKQMQIEAEHGFPKWSDPMEISVSFDVSDAPDTRGGIYMCLYASVMYMCMEATCYSHT